MTLMPKLREDTPEIVISGSIVGSPGTLRTKHNNSAHSRVIRAQVTIAAIAVFGAALALYTMARGIGTDVDSATYLIAARNLLAGNGLSIQIAGSAHTVRLTSFPPLLPVALATMGYVGIDPLVGAKWLNAALFGADIFLIAVFIKRYTGSDIAAVFSAFLMATNVDVRINQCMLISEPLFLFCVLAGLIFITSYIDTPTLPLLFGFSAAFAAAGAARYIGASLLPVGAYAIAFAPSPSRLRRMHLGIYAGVFACPVVGWVARNVVLSHTFTNRSAAFHPPGLDRFVFSYLSLSTWLLPSVVPQYIRIVILAAAIALILRPLLYRSKTARQPSAKPQLDGILIALLSCYILGFVIAQTFFDAQIWIAGRHLLLIYIVGSMVVISQITELLRSASPRFRITGFCLCIAILGVGLLRTGKNVLKVHDEGLGLSSMRWQTSELILKTKELDGQVPIITNSTALVYLRTGKLAYGIPSRVNSQTERLNPQYPGEMAWINNEIQHEGAVVVYFTGFLPPQSIAPTENDLEVQWGVRRLATTVDGYLLAKR